MTHLKTILIGYLIIVNVFAFFLMGLDKRKAQQHMFRIPERNLFLTAIAGGSIGAMIGMYLFRHKIRRLQFVIGLPLIFVIQLLLLALLLSWNQRQMSSPSQTVTEQLNLIRDLDENTINSYISYQNLTNTQVDGSSFGEEAARAVQLFFAKFRYSVKSESINGEEALVKVSVSNIDARALAEDVCTGLLKRSVRNPAEKPASFTTGDYYQLLCDTLQSNTYEQTETEVSFHLKRDNSVWVILADEELEDELVGHFISYINDPYLIAPETCLSVYLDAFQSMDARQWADFLQIDDMFAMYNETYSPQIDQAYMEQVASHFAYTILRCRTEGSEAEADLRITGPALISILDDFREQLISYAEAPQSVRNSDEAESDAVSSMLLDIIKGNQKSSSTDFIVTMHNNGRGWEISLGEAFTNALLGNITDALASFGSVEQETITRTLNALDTELR